MSEIETNAAAPSSKAINWIVVGACWVSLYVLGLVDNIRGAVFPDLLQTFGLSSSVGSLFFMISSGTAFLVNIMTPWWLARLGPWLGLQIFTVIQALGLFAVGVAPSFAWVMLGGFFIGASVGGLGVVQNVAVSLASPVQAHRKTFAGLHGMYALASFMAPLMISGLYAFGLAWQQSFVLFSLVPLALFLWTLFVPHDRVDVGHAEHARTKVKVPVLWTSVVGAVLTFYIIGEIMLATRMTLFLRQVHGMSLAEANWQLGLFFLGLLLGRVVTAVVRVPGKSWHLLWISAALTLAFSLWGLRGWYGGLALSGLSMSVFYPMVMSWVSEEIPEVGAHAMPWIIALTGFGIMSMHGIMGVLTDRIGIENALYVVPGAAFASIVGLHVLKIFHKTAPQGAP